MTTASKSIGLENVSESLDMPKGKAYVFAIGIDRYDHVNPLHNAVRDVKQVVDLLTSRYQFDREHVTMLIDENAKRSDIHREFKQLAKTVSPQDVLLVYYSGHGIEDNDDGYWIPVDGLPGDTATYVSNIEIINFLKKIDSFHTVVISDSCFSGTLFAGIERRVLARQRLEKTPSRWGMTSGRKEPVLDGIPGENSPFADSLLLHLRNNPDPVLPITWLFDTIMEDMGSNYKQTPRCEPLGDVGHRGGEFMFHVKGPVAAIPEKYSPVSQSPPPAPRNYWEKPRVQIGIALTGIVIVGLILVGLFTDIFTGDKDQIIDKKPAITTISANQTTIKWGPVATGELKARELVVQNNGPVTAQLDSVAYQCSDIAIKNNVPDSIAAHQVKKFTVIWKAGNVPGKQQCVLLLRGKNVENVIQIVAEAEVVEPEPTVAVSKPDNSGSSTSVKIIATQTTIDLGEIPAGKSRSFKFTLQNQGNSPSASLTANMECSDGSSAGPFQLESISAKGRRTYTETWPAGEETGIHRCTLSIKGHPARIVITARIVSEPPPPVSSCIVRCNTGGLSGVRIWFYDTGGNEYSQVSQSGQQTISFKIPCAMIGKKVEVNFDKNGKQDYRKVEFLRDRAFELPSAIKDQ